MTEQEIKILLEKYFDGETTLEEEECLSAYFNGEIVASALKEYQPLFQFFKVEKQITLSESAALALEKIPEQAPKLKIEWGRQWWKAAAAIAIMGVGSFFLIDVLYKKDPTQLTENHRITIYDEHDDPEKAFAEVQAALKLVSKKMKKGNTQTLEGLNKVKKASKELDKIMPHDY